MGAENIRVEGPIDSAAGHLVHLRSDIRFESDLTTTQVASALHPTPAVAGLPMETSLSVIRELENHDRQLYAGYMGWADNKEGDELFVLLRYEMLAKRGVALRWRRYNRSIRSKRGMAGN